MHDKEKVLETVVTKKDILDFMEANLPDKCPICLHDECSLEGGDEGNDVMLMIRRPGLPVYIECYATCCAQCGHVRIYSKYAVKLWKQKKESEYREIKASEEPSRPIWVNIILHNGKHIEIPIMWKSIARVSAINQLEPNPFRSKIKLIDGRVFEVIEDCDVIKQKIEYARG